ncbi:hypothetical protein AAHC03_04446 [Spirometra sp. Aus1]
MLSETRNDENNRAFVPLKNNLDMKQGLKKRGLQVSDPNVDSLSTKEYLPSKTVIVKSNPRDFDVEVCIPPMGEGSFGFHNATCTIDFSSAFILCDAVDDLFDRVSELSVQHMSSNCRPSNDFQNSFEYEDSGGLIIPDEMLCSEVPGII